MYPNFLGGERETSSSTSRRTLLKQHQPDTLHKHSIPDKSTSRLRCSYPATHGIGRQPNQRVGNLYGYPMPALARLPKGLGFSLILFQWAAASRPSFHNFESASVIQSSHSITGSGWYPSNDLSLDLQRSATKFLVAKSRSYQAYLLTHFRQVLRSK